MKRTPFFALAPLAVVSAAAWGQEPPPAPPQPAAPPPAGAPAPEPPAAPLAPPAAAAPQAAPPPAAPAPPPRAAAALQAPAAAANPALGADGNPLAGWHNGLFYLRDAHDDFRLYLQGRAQIDLYSYAGPGVPDSPLKATLLLRRIRPELTGEILHSWWFMIAGDFGVTSNDNPRGTTETSAAAPGADPSATSARYASAQTARLTAQATDVFVGYTVAPAHGLLNIQVGQFDAPFTMENRTSDKYFPFMERSLAVRVVGVPTNKEIGAMLWGEMPNKLFFYSVGAFDGDGQNRLNVDGRGDVMGRAFVHPLATVMKNELKDAQIGLSGRYGERRYTQSFYDYPAMTTQGNYTFWTPIYNGSKGFTHVLPSGSQRGFAGELRVPFSMIDLTSEIVYVANNTREAVEGFQATNTERLGAMKGTSYYIELGIWPLGKRDVNGMPGYENVSHVDFKKADPETPAQALQLLAKWEQLHLTYDGASRGGAPDAKKIDGAIKVDALSFGANYWATKHIRLSANYVIDMFRDSAPAKATHPGGPQQTSDQRALAPGNTLATGINDAARDEAHVLHEILFRTAVAL